MITKKTIIFSLTTIFLTIVYNALQIVDGHGGGGGDHLGGFITAIFFGVPILILLFITILSFIADLLPHKNGIVKFLLGILLLCGIAPLYFISWQFIVDLILNGF